MIDELERLPRCIVLRSFLIRFGGSDSYWPHGDLMQCGFLMCISLCRGVWYPSKVSRTGHTLVFRVVCGVVCGVSVSVRVRVMLLKSQWI